MYVFIGRVCIFDPAFFILSDAHAIEEVGLDDSVRPYLEEEDFPEELLINSSAEKAFAFIEERKVNKKE